MSEILFNSCFKEKIASLYQGSYAKDTFLRDVKVTKSTFYYDLLVSEKTTKYF